jgi:phenylalanine ammonia-lyase
MVVYGVNTGFGGSADTRTTAVEEFQRALLRMLHYGLLAGKTLFESRVPESDELCEILLQSARPLNDATAATVMPESWVRASMLVRLNSLSASASGVKLETVRILADMITKDVVPLVPIRGSISASGDLSPLSYIGGVMQGKPTVAAFVGNRLKSGERKSVRADQAMAVEGITPIVLGPKEGERSFLNVLQAYTDV